jgi:SAM-dependent methyltransferase
VNELDSNKVILLDLTPKELLRVLSGRLPASYQRALERYRFGAGVFKVDYALHQQIPFRALACLSAVTVHLGGGFEEIARSEAAAARGLRVIARLHPAEHLPYADASFDLVTCRVAAHHFSSPPDFVRESARVLQPGGWFLLIDGSMQDDEEEAEEWLHQVEKLRDPSHHRLLTPRNWARLCQAAGLRVTHSELDPFKQPDLNWYFETAATPPVMMPRRRPTGRRSGCGSSAGSTGATGDGGPPGAIRRAAGPAESRDIASGSAAAGTEGGAVGATGGAASGADDASGVGAAVAGRGGGGATPGP